MHRHYFALSTNSGEQFFAFTSVAAWLLQMCGKHVEQPQEVSTVFFMFRFFILIFWFSLLFSKSATFKRNVNLTFLKKCALMQKILAVKIVTLPKLMIY